MIHVCWIFGLVASVAILFALKRTRNLKHLGKSLEEARKLADELPFVIIERNRLKEDLEGAQKRFNELERKCEDAITAKASLEATLSEKEKQLEASKSDSEKERQENADQLRQQFKALVDGLESRFGIIANEKMKEGRHELSELNKEQIEGVLKPLKDQLKELNNLASNAKSANEKLGADMERHVGEIGDFARELSRVRDALTSSMKIAGETGEEILERKLKESGLQKGISYFIQAGSAEDRPDAQVCDAENRRFVIDSKLNLSDYIAAQEANDEATRNEKLKAHVSAMRRQIDSLGRKNYPVAMEKLNIGCTYLPTTVMFVPYEAPLLAALDVDPSLLQYAADRKVVLLTPLTLNAYIRLVSLAWQQKNTVDNAAQIVRVAKNFLIRINDYVKKYEELGEAIEAMSRKHREAGSLIVDTSNSHSIAKSAKQLVDCGIRLEGRSGKRKELAQCLLDVGAGENGVDVQADASQLDGTVADSSQK